MYNTKLQELTQPTDLTSPSQRTQARESLALLKQRLKQWRCTVNDTGADVDYDVLFKNNIITHLNNNTLPPELINHVSAIINNEAFTELFSNYLDQSKRLNLEHPVVEVLDTYIKDYLTFILQTELFDDKSEEQLKIHLIALIESETFAHLDTNIQRIPPLQTLIVQYLKDNISALDNYLITWHKQYISNELQAASDIPTPKVYAAITEKAYTLLFEHLITEANNSEHVKHVLNTLFQNVLHKNNGLYLELLDHNIIHSDAFTPYLSMVRAQCVTRIKQSQPDQAVITCVQDITISILRRQWQAANSSSENIELSESVREWLAKNDIPQVLAQIHELETLANRGVIEVAQDTMARPLFAHEMQLMQVVLAQAGKLLVLPPEQVTHLKLILLQGQDDDDIVRFIQSRPNINELDFSDSQFGPVQIERFAKSCLQLRSLYCAHMQHVTTLSIVDLTQLEQLVVSGSNIEELDARTPYNEKVLSISAQNCPKLRVLQLPTVRTTTVDITGENAITQTHVDRLRNCNTHLTIYYDAHFIDQLIRKYPQFSKSRSLLLESADHLPQPWLVSLLDDQSNIRDEIFWMLDQLQAISLNAGSNDWRKFFDQFGYFRGGHQDYTILLMANLPVVPVSLERKAVDAEFVKRLTKDTPDFQMLYSFISGLVNWYHSDYFKACAADERKNTLKLALFQHIMFFAYRKAKNSYCSFDIWALLTRLIPNSEQRTNMILNHECFEEGSLSQSLSKAYMLRYCDLADPNVVSCLRLLFKKVSNKWNYAIAATLLPLAFENESIREELFAYFFERSCNLSDDEFLEASAFIITTDPSYLSKLIDTINGLQLPNREKQDIQPWLIKIAVSVCLRSDNSSWLERIISDGNRQLIQHAMDADKTYQNTLHGALEQKSMYKPDSQLLSSLSSLTCLPPEHLKLLSSTYCRNMTKDTENTLDIQSAVNQFNERVEPFNRVIRVQQPLPSAPKTLHQWSDLMLQLHDIAPHIADQSKTQASSKQLCSMLESLFNNRVTVLDHTQQQAPTELAIQCDHLIKPQIQLLARTHSNNNKEFGFVLVLPAYYSLMGGVLGKGRRQTIASDNMYQDTQNSVIFPLPTCSIASDSAWWVFHAVVTILTRGSNNLQNRNLVPSMAINALRYYLPELSLEAEYKAHHQVDDRPFFKASTSQTQLTDQTELDTFATDRHKHN